MEHSSRLERLLRLAKRVIPSPLFAMLQPGYHYALAWLAALRYGFPSRGLTVIGVTGSKGKSTTVFLITRLFEAAGMPVAAIGSLGVRIGGKDVKNQWGNTMPGRFALQGFLAKAKKNGARYAVIEVTSEGILSFRHKGIRFDAAVFTNLEREHIERHGSFENYRAAKGELFRHTSHLHVLNADDPNFAYFKAWGAERVISFGIQEGEVRAEHLQRDAHTSTFSALGRDFTVHLPGLFNVMNALAALSVAYAYNLNLAALTGAFAGLKRIFGRFEEIIPEGGTDIRAIVDYAHTPESLRAVYRTAREGLHGGARLIGVLGAAGGGRDRWKRPEFGKLAAEFCDRIILTDEDPYDEDAELIIQEIMQGLPPDKPAEVVLDREAAIWKAVSEAKSHDTVLITGKGSEEFIHGPHGSKIPWSDRTIAEAALKSRQAAVGSDKRNGSH